MCKIWIISWFWILFLQNTPTGVKPFWWQNEIALFKIAVRLIDHSKVWRQWLSVLEGRRNDPIHTKGALGWTPFGVYSLETRFNSRCYLELYSSCTWWFKRHSAFVNRVLLKWSFERRMGYQSLKILTYDLYAEILILLLALRLNILKHRYWF